MYNIWLSKRDKKFLKVVTREGIMNNTVLPREEMVIVAEYLKEVGLIEIQKRGGEFYTARLTNFGQKFKLENPKLKNEISDNLKWKISTAVAIIIAIISLISQFINCL